MSFGKISLVFFGFLLSQNVLAKNYLSLSYENNNYKEVSDAKTVKLDGKYFTNNFFESIYGNIQYKEWDTKDSALDASGVSGQVVGFYDIDEKGKFFGSTQLQLASSNLFPKSTLYQEISYRAGEKNNILLGIGVGHQDYYDNDADVFFKVGPVYYFDGSAVGYKYGKYKDTKSTLNSLFVDYYINDNWTVDMVYNFGKGHWDNIRPYGVASANVDYDELKVGVNHKINQSLKINADIGKSKMVNKDTKKDFLNSNNLNLGFTYLW